MKKGLYESFAEGATTFYASAFLFFFPLLVHDGYKDILNVKTGFFYFATFLYFLCILPGILDSFLRRKDTAVPRKGSSMRQKGSAAPAKGSAVPRKGSAAPAKGPVVPRKGSAAPAKGSVMPRKGSAAQWLAQAVKSEPAGTDGQMLLFLLLAVLSFLLNGQKEALFWGSYGRNFGLLAILCCVAAYFGLTRHLKISPAFAAANLAAAALTASLAVLNFWGFDPLSMYGEMKPKTQFISTMGNMNTYAAYLGMTLPFGMAMFFACRHRRSRKIYGAFCFLGFLGMPAANSDSVYLCVGAAFLLLLCFSSGAEEGERIGILAALFALAGFLFGCVYRLRGAGHRLALKGGLPALFTGGWICAGILGFSFLTLLLLRRTGRGGGRADAAWKRARKCLFLCLGACFAALLALVLWANLAMNAEEAEEALGAFYPYLYLGDAWGTKRMQIWKAALAIFSRLGIGGKLFGTGPAGFYFASQKYLTAEELAVFEKRGVLLDAHSVYLQYLLTFGVLGLLAFTALLGHVLRLFWHKAKEEKEAIAFLLPVAAYAVQACINNAHIYTEPFLFFWIAAGVARSARTSDF